MDNAKIIKSSDPNKTLAQVRILPIDTVVASVNAIRNYGSVCANQSVAQDTEKEAPIKKKSSLDDAKGVSHNNFSSVAQTKTMSNHSVRSFVGHDHSTSGNKTVGICGLRNIGNTCFMNSAIQCLSNIEILTNYFISQDYRHDINKSNKLGTQGNVANAYADLITRIWSQMQAPIEPIEIKREVARYAPQFTDLGQHDSHEFMDFLIDALHEDLKDGTGSSFISKLFHGTIATTVQCAYHACRKPYITDSDFTFLSLPIETSKDKMTGIESCLAALLEGESLGKKGQWLCQYCGKKSNASKTIQIEYFPKILILHLKRFDFEFTDEKIDTKVIYPIKNLDLNRYGKTKSGTAHYNLIGVSMHQGFLKGGHYTTVAKNFKRKKWYCFDDHHVMPVLSKDEVVSNDAYILIYEQVES